jgi:ketosteroid isomerase-like protein
MAEESTTPDLRELALQMTEAGNRGDLDAYMSHFAHDAVWHTRFGESLEGVTATRSFFEEFSGSVEGYRAEVLEFVDLGGGVAFSVSRQGGRLRGSASELDEYVAFVTVIEGGLIESMTTYSDIDEARAEAERLAQERAGG